MARNYNQMEIYHRSYQFALEVYHLTKDFPKQEEQNITSQLRRASISIPLNIAEGSAKASAREFAYFLNNAYASAKEVEVLINLSRDLKYFKEDEHLYLATKLDHLNSKLFLFIRSIEAQVKQKKFQFFKKFEDKIPSSQ